VPRTATGFGVAQRVTILADYPGGHERDQYERRELVAKLVELWFDYLKNQAKGVAVTKMFAFDGTTLWLGRGTRPVARWLVSSRARAFCLRSRQRRA
jgi:hypothetical protein